MTAFKQNLKIDQGASFSQLVTWMAGDPAVAVDLTGCSALAQVRAKIDDATVLHEFSSATGGIAMGGATGTIELVMTDEETAAATWRAGVYDLLISFPSGSKRRLMYGSITITPGVTRA